MSCFFFFFGRIGQGSKISLLCSKGCCQCKSSYLPVRKNLDRHEGRNSTFDGFYCTAALALSGINPPFSKESEGINNWTEHEAQKHANHAVYLWKVKGSLICDRLQKRQIKWYLNLRSCNVLHVAHDWDKVFVSWVQLSCWSVIRMSSSAPREPRGTADAAILWNQAKKWNGVISVARCCCAGSISFPFLQATTCSAPLSDRHHTHCPMNTATHTHTLVLYCSACGDRTQRDLNDFPTCLNSGFINVLLSSKHICRHQTNSREDRDCPNVTVPPTKAETDGIHLHIILFEWITTIHNRVSMSNLRLHSNIKLFSSYTF